MKLAKEIAKEARKEHPYSAQAVYTKWASHESAGKHAVFIGVDQLESLIAAKLEEYHRTMKVRLESVEYALDPGPKWTDDTHKLMTQQEILMMVRCVLSILSEEE